MREKILVTAVIILTSVASLWGKSNDAEKTSMPEWLEGSEIVGDITAVNTPTEGGLDGGGSSGDVNIGIANGGVTTSKIADEGTTGQVLTSTGGTGVEWQTPSGGTDSWSLSGNSGTDPASDYLGTSDNQPLIIKINNDRIFRLEPHSTCPNIIGGLSTNSVTPGLYGVTIGGGGEPGTGNNNRVTSYGNFGTIGGGRCNLVTENSATVSGGRWNEATGSFTAIGGGDGNSADGSEATVGGGCGNSASGLDATVSGGFVNTASGMNSYVGGGDHNNATGENSTVSGGDKNDADGNYSTIGGGSSNEANGAYSSVPGGEDNVAAGDYSFAAGHRAIANASGSFVWADNSSGSNLTGTVGNQWLARCSGGVWFYTNSNLTSGVILAAGGSAWSSVSDRNLKENFEEVDGQEVLDKLEGIPVTTWNYKAQDQSIRHIGPMAQDFHSAFGVGEDDKHITTVDVDGVTLAAIKALYEQNQKKDDEIKNLRTQLDSLEARINALEGLK